jgi:hypothetical protein
MDAWVKGLKLIFLTDLQNGNLPKAYLGYLSGYKAKAAEFEARAAEWG